MSAWDPEQYERFREERQQPFYDLLKLVLPRRGMRILDLGCGTGELTREMHRHFKASETLGVDSSETMLAGTRELKDEGLSFQHGRIEDFTAAAPFDLVLSNAALHWLPEHGRVIEKLASLMGPGGQLALQMPANQDHPSHVVANAVAGEAPFVEHLGSEGVRQHVLPVEQYALHLARLGFRAQHVRLQVYLHRLPSREGVVEWVKGAMLTDFKRRLSPGLYDAFLARYRERLLPLLDDLTPYPYTFKRLFVWGERP